MTNPTMQKFGHPTTLIHDYADWVVLLRNDQITLGSLVVAEKSPATSLSAVKPRALAELASIAGDVETAFARTFQPDKFNYLKLMMVDPNVHFHVLPRYSGARECAGVTFEDRAWPKAPSIGDVTPTTLAQREVILGLLRDAWPG